jgi:hypothetical protein
MTAVSDARAEGSRPVKAADGNVVLALRGHVFCALLPVGAADGSGGLTLIADLGCFTISTNTAAAKNLTAEETALYECFLVRVDHVSAYLLDGQFGWPSNDELLEASGGKLPAAASSGAVLGQTANSPQYWAAAGVAGDQEGDSVLQQLLGRKARIVPLLYRFGLGMDVQVATSVHPR